MSVPITVDDPGPNGEVRSDDGAVEPLLSVRGLRTVFEVGSLLRRRSLVAVDGVDLDIPAGTSLGLVGESGSGKSTLVRCIMSLEEPTAGTIRFAGRDLAGAGERERLELYGDMQMVFQDPLESLNPRRTVEQTVAEPLRRHGDLGRRDARDRVRELLALVGLADAHLDRFPHELSGGQRQRVGIARALSVDPRLLVLDEPTASLDVSVRGQILKLLLDLQQRLGLAYLFVSHDLAAVRRVTDRVLVMYLGRVLEAGPSPVVLREPRHPYSRALLSAVPVPVHGRRPERVRLEGEIPSPLALPPGCRLVGRCPMEVPECSTVHPGLEELADDHHVACHVLHRPSLRQLQEPVRGDGAAAADEI
ncbi:MAG: oligopeptide/dipeptide ABC transporter ATP-binding protein [Actinomycetota bacterium]|nr:oligopeptide/dipeptide ABC transporter ATP-binding protein [Actinomycetota bacterium]